MILFGRNIQDSKFKTSWYATCLRILGNMLHAFWIQNEKQNPLYYISKENKTWAPHRFAVWSSSKVVKWYNVWLLGVLTSYGDVGITFQTQATSDVSLRVGTGSWISNSELIFWCTYCLKRQVYHGITYRYISVPKHTHSKWI